MLSCYSSLLDDRSTLDDIGAPGHVHPVQGPHTQWHAVIVKKRTGFVNNWLNISLGCNLLRKWGTHAGCGNQNFLYERRIKQEELIAQLYIHNPLHKSRHILLRRYTGTQFSVFAYKIFPHLTSLCILVSFSKYLTKWYTKML